MSAPPTPLCTKRVAGTPARSASTEREADVLDVLEARAEDRESGLAVHQVMPDLRRHLGVALVTTERGDAHMVTGIEHRRPSLTLAAIDSLAYAISSRVVPEVGQGVAHLGRRGATRGRTEHHADQRDDRDPEEQPTEHVGRVARAQVQRRHAHEDDDEQERATQRAARRTGRAPAPAP